MLVLATEAATLRLGLKPQAELLGYCLNTDGYHMAMPSPERIADCLQGALRNARLGPDAIDYYNAHGTSTPLNDEVETQVIKTVFGNRHGRLPISSIKGAVGHGPGAAAVIEAAACIRAIRDQMIPTNHQLLARSGARSRLCPDPAASSAILAKVMSSSFGFGGTNNVLIFGDGRI